MDESLAKLKSAFAEWRSRKRYVREAIPVELVRQARAAARRHGSAAVYRVTKVDLSRLKDAGRSRVERRPPATGVAAYSRLKLAAPAASSRLFAEVEMPTGLKVRLFTGTDEALGLLSSLLARGGGAQ
jgi:hypothetical protein